MKIFCHECGSELIDDAKFCENCAAKVPNDSDLGKINSARLKIGEYFLFLGRKISKIKDISPIVLSGVAFLSVIFFVSYSFYESYEKTQQTILQTSQQLKETNEKLNNIASSTAQKLSNQEQELNQKTNQITKLEADLKSTSKSNITSSNVGSNALSSLSPSVVKIICYSDAYGENLQMGSGVLYHSDSPDPSTYFVETNLHVVQTSDGSASKCIIALYPSYRNTSNYLVYKTTGYTTYKYGVDFVYIIPQITTSENSGTMSDLEKYAKNLTSNTYCKSTNIGDHMSVLGYPGIGGSSLTATDGIISGFEYDNGSRFIKTSAKIEHGNSGGVAIKDSGCILGIPTFVETGSAESIGRILDLNDLFN